MIHEIKSNESNELKRINEMDEMSIERRPSKEIQYSFIHSFKYQILQ